MLASLLKNKNRNASSYLKSKRNFDFLLEETSFSSAGTSPSRKVGDTDNYLVTSAQRFNIVI